MPGSCAEVVLESSLNPSLGQNKVSCISSSRTKCTRIRLEKIFFLLFSYWQALELVLSSSLILWSVKLTNSCSTSYSLKSLARALEISFSSRIHEVICFFSYYFFSMINFDVSTNSSTNLLLYILVLIFFFGYSFLFKSAYKLIKTSSFSY